MRAEHGACTMRALAGALRISDTGARNILEGLRQRGFVAWTKMPGSLRVVAVADPEIAARPTLPPPPPPGPQPGIVADMQAEINRLLARCNELSVAAEVKPKRKPRTELNAGQKAAAARAKRPPTEKELVARARLGQMTRDRVAAAKALAAGSAPAEPQSDEDAAEGADGEESREAV